MPENIENLNMLFLNLSEHQHQVELFAWAAVVGHCGLFSATQWSNQHPLHVKRKAKPTKGLGDNRLRWLHAIPNGGSRGGDKLGAAIVGARMKAGGVRRGVPDLFLPLPMGGFGGLYVELKRANGRLSNLTAEQREFRDYAQASGYAWSVCFGYMQAIDVLTKYLNLEAK